MSSDGTLASSAIVVDEIFPASYEETGTFIDSIT